MKRPRSGVLWDWGKSCQLLPNADAGGDKAGVALLDGGLAGAAPVGERGADDHPGGPVGVDVEDTRRAAPLRVAHRFFSPAERAALSALAPPLSLPAPAGAQELSPRRKPWVKALYRTTPAGA